MKSARKRIVNHRAVFKQRTKTDDNQELSFELIIATRKTGQLDLSGRGLTSGGLKLYKLSPKIINNLSLVGKPK